PLRICTDKLVCDPSVSEQHHIRDALNAELHRQAGIRLGVDLSQNESAPILLSQLLQNRTKRATRSAPGGPEVDQDWDSRGFLNDLFLERFFVDGNYKLRWKFRHCPSRYLSSPSVYRGAADPGNCGFRIEGCRLKTQSPISLARSNLAVTTECRESPGWVLKVLAILKPQSKIRNRQLLRNCPTQRRESSVTD